MIISDNDPPPFFFACIALSLGDWNTRSSSAGGVGRDWWDEMSYLPFPTYTVAIGDAIYHLWLMSEAQSGSASPIEKHWQHPVAEQERTSAWQD